MEAITFPDAEAVVVGYLNSLLIADGDTARASTRVPGERPGRLVRPILTGSSRRNLSQQDAQVTVECWAPSGPDAAALARKVYGWLSALDVDGAHVPQGSDGWVGGPYSDPDPDTGSPRYTMTVIVRQRAVTLEAS